MAEGSPKKEKKEKPKEPKEDKKATKDDKKEKSDKGDKKEVLNLHLVLMRRFGIDFARPRLACRKARKLHAKASHGVAHRAMTRSLATIRNRKICLVRQLPSRVNSWLGFLSPRASPPPRATLLTSFALPTTELPESTNPPTAGAAPDNLAAVGASSSALPPQSDRLHLEKDFFQGTVSYSNNAMLGAMYAGGGSFNSGALAGQQGLFPQDPFGYLADPKYASYQTARTPPGPYSAPTPIPPPAQPMGGAVDNPVNAICPIHNTPITQYCESCRAPCCVDCSTYGAHCGPGHMVVPIQQVYMSRAKSIRFALDSSVRKRSLSLTHTTPVSPTVSPPTHSTKESPKESTSSSSTPRGVDTASDSSTSGSRSAPSSL